MDGGESGSGPCPMAGLTFVASELVQEKQSVSQSDIQPVTQPTTQSIIHSFNQPVSQLVNQLTRKSINE